MARAKSVILSPAEKKQIVADLKNQIKVVKDAVKATSSFIKEKEKLHAATIKTESKKAAEHAKTLAGLTAKLTSLTAKPA